MAHDVAESDRIKKWQPGNPCILYTSTPPQPPSPPPHLPTSNHLQCNLRDVSKGLFIYHVIRDGGPWATYDVSRGTWLNITKPVCPIISYFFPGNFQLFCPTTNKWVFSWLWSPQFFSICWLRSIPKDLVNHVTFPNWVKPSRHRNPTAKEFFFLPIFLHRPHPRTNSGNKIRNLSVEPGYSEANGAENGARSAQHILHWRRCSTPS